MRASSRGTSTVPRHLLEKRGREEETRAESVVVLEELTSTLERTLERIKELRAQQRAAA